MPVWHDARVTVLAAGFAGLVALAAITGTTALVVAVLVVQAGFLAGWMRLADVHAQQPGSALALAAAAAADLLAARGGAGVAGSPMGALAGLLGAAFLLALFVQLLRRDRRLRVTASLTATVTATVLTLSGALWLAPGHLAGGRHLVPVVASGLACGVLAVLLPGPWQVRAVAGALLGALAGALVVLPGATGGSSSAGAALLGLAAAGVGAAGLTAASYASLGRRASVVTATLPVLLGGPLAWVAGRAVGA